MIYKLRGGGTEIEKKRFSLILEPTSKRLSVDKGLSIYEAILALDFPLGAFCGGEGTCGKCLIQILDSNPNISEPTEKEKKNLGEQKISEGYRLACQTRILGDLRVYLTDTLIPKGPRILVDSDLETLGINKSVKNQPIIASQYVEVKNADLADPKNDLSRLEDAIKAASDKFRIISNPMFHSLDDTLYDIIRKLPHIVRNQNGKITAFFRKLSLEEPWTIYDIDVGDVTDKLFGLAVDIGTTTIVGYLIYLKTGEIAAISALLNPQIMIGEDVISRITYIVKNEAIERAKELIVNAINQILEDCCDKANISVSEIRDISIVGNTAMHHMVFGIPSEFLAVSPYSPAFKTPINLRAGTIGLMCNPNVNVYSPPVVAGYVGTDTIGGIISSKINTFNKYSLLIDIGTNGELVMGNKEGLVTGSCAAGSALEGAHISCGMRASEGAIESVIIDRETLEPSIEVIGNQAPLGLCGSGLIDTVAEMLKSKIITRAGIFNSKLKEVINHRRIVKKEDGYHYILYSEKWDKKFFQTSGDYNEIREITISQKDINQLQLAKGAFLTAANLLLKMENKTENDIEQVLLAGGFGTYINKKSAAFIGLFPEVDQDNIFQIGNSAGLGAQIFIKNLEQRRLANQIAHKIRYREIASSPMFQSEFTFSLYFPHYDLDKFPKTKQEYNQIPLK
ncbi:MAG: ASKHA domain-containing protein [Candidatus Hermodarchaeota archaeon]